MAQQGCNCTAMAYSDYVVMVQRCHLSRNPVKVGCFEFAQELCPIPMRHNAVTYHSGLVTRFTRIDPTRERLAARFYALRYPLW